MDLRSNMSVNQRSEVTEKVGEAVNHVKRIRQVLHEVFGVVEDFPVDEMGISNSPVVSGKVAQVFSEFSEREKAIASCLLLIEESFVKVGEIISTLIVVFEKELNFCTQLQAVANYIEEAKKFFNDLRIFFFRDFSAENLVKFSAILRVEVNDAIGVNCYVDDSSISPLDWLISSFLVQTEKILNGIKNGLKENIASFL